MLLVVAFVVQYPFHALLKALSLLRLVPRVKVCKLEYAIAEFRRNDVPLWILFRTAERQKDHMYAERGPRVTCK